MDRGPGHLSFIKGIDVVCDGLDFITSQKFAFERVGFIEFFAFESEQQLK